MSEDTLDREEETEAPGESSSATVDELIRAATRLMMGSAGIAVASARRWQGEGVDGPATGGAGNLASAALGLGLAAERVIVRGATTVGGTAASVTWGVMRAGPFRGPVERLAEWFRGEQQLSEQEVSEGVGAILDALGGAVLGRLDVDRVIDRLALERVLARFDRRELAERIEGSERQTGS